MESYEQLLEENYETYILKKKKKPIYYVIQEGKNKGIYYSWSELKEKISKNTIYRKFTKKQDAVNYIDYNYTSDDLVLSEDDIALLSYNKKGIYDVLDINKSPFNINKLNKNNIQDDNNSYIFISGSSNKKNKKNIQSKYGIYFGSQSINISEIEDTKTDVPYLLAVDLVIKLLDKNKKQIKEYQKINPTNIIHIVLDDTYNYNIFKYWIHKWCKTNWKTKREVDITNKNIIKNIYFIMSKLKLHNINYGFKFINCFQLPPTNNSHLEHYLWKTNLYSKYLTELVI